MLQILNPEDKYYMMQILNPEDKNSTTYLKPNQFTIDRCLNLFKLTQN